MNLTPARSHPHALFGWDLDVRLPTLGGKPPIVIGHRGAPGYLPDHTLASYRRAIELGADYIEPDLIATREGELIARHDLDLAETTDVADHPEFALRKTRKTIDGLTQEGWFADDFTLAEIKTLRARQPFPFRPQQYNGRYPIPTFEEILRLVEQQSRRSGRRIGLYPEIKHPSYHAKAGLHLELPLRAALERHGLNARHAPVIIQSFEVAHLKALRPQTPVRLVQLVDAVDGTPEGARAPGRPYDFTLNGDPRTYADLVTEAGLREVATYADGIGPWKGYLFSLADRGSRPSGNDVDREPIAPSRVVADAHRAGLFVHTWTFRDEPHFLAPDYRGDPAAEYLKYYQLGVDGVFSDFPDTAVRARARLLRPR